MAIPPSQQILTHFSLQFMIFRGGFFPGKMFHVDIIYSMGSVFACTHINSSLLTYSHNNVCLWIAVVSPLFPVILEGGLV